jgi:hypothetical protein
MRVNLNKIEKKLTIIILMLFLNPYFSWAEPSVQDISINGDWQFTYTSELELSEPTSSKQPIPVIPENSDFTIHIKVPSHWIRERSKMKEASWWKEAKFNPDYEPIQFPYPEEKGGPKHPDASFPYLLGVGWYKKIINVPTDWNNRLITLRIGGVRTECYLYVNGSYIGRYRGHSTPFEFDLSSYLRYGNINELLLAVSNLDYHPYGCDLRGYQGYSGGIYGDVSLHVSGGQGVISNLFLYPVSEMKSIRWKVELKAPAGTSSETTILQWEVRDSDGRVVREGEVPIPPLNPGERYQKIWDIDAKGIKAWSIWDPILYNTEIIWKNREGKVWDRKKQSFGLRSLTQDGKKLYLNGRPILLRGICEIYYYPPNIHPDISVDYFKGVISRLKEVGYNYIRFHTWVPPQEYQQAADELGMLLQVELPENKPRDIEDLQQWERIIRWSRVHPSIAIYCGGNEETSVEGLVSFYEQMYDKVKELDPSALFMAMEHLRGIEPGSRDRIESIPRHVNDQAGYLDHLLERAINISDILAERDRQDFGDLSYLTLIGRGWREIEPGFSLYQKPLLYHELGIVGCYLNLKLEDRYNGTIPRDLFDAARKNIERAGRLSMVERYYENSARWQSITHKYLIEKARKCESLDGYDHLGGWDPHWHRAGYGCGMLNEFLELKPGSTVEEMLQYNGESVLLLEDNDDHVYREGELFEMGLIVSLYGGRPLRNGVLEWSVTDGKKVFLEGRKEHQVASDGRVTELDTLSFRWPDLEEAKKLKLNISLTGSGYNLKNSWDFWIFPEEFPPGLNASADRECLSKLSERYPGLKPVGQQPSVNLRIVHRLTNSDISHLENGGDILLLGSEPFPWNPTQFRIGVAGRAVIIPRLLEDIPGLTSQSGEEIREISENHATVVYDHPVFRDIPHEGWCDWQFKPLLKGGRCTVFNELRIEFDPILEIVSTYKNISLQASIWEAQTEEGGKLFVASCNFDMDNPSCVALLDGIVRYITGDKFRPDNKISIRKDLKPLLKEED